MKRKVLLADDEPFILQGLAVLVDWEAEGFEIVKMASDGAQALEYLKENQVDLIIADIQMPSMTGLELLQIIREDHISDADFVILSGYSDFQYAQKAIRNSCMDYILKPVQQDVLLQVLARVSQQKERVERKEADYKKMEQDYITQNLASLLCGQYDQTNLDYISEKLKLSDQVRYIHICFANMAALEELDDGELASMRRRMFENCRQYLGSDGDHCFERILGYEEDYEIGFVYCDYMAKDRNMTEETFLAELHKNANMGGFNVPIVLLVGKMAQGIAKISKSYSSACMLRPFKSFHSSQNVYFYEEELQVNQQRVLLCKQTLDRLIGAVEQNDKGKIGSSVTELFKEMEIMGMTRDIVSMNTNYLLFQLIHLAVEQDESVNQEEVMLYISENVSESGIVRGSRAHFSRFACEYADYLIQLRKNVSRGVLVEIEKEIKEHYAENLTLRELSQKYYVNSAYLGQIFRKHYGQSFKDYLSSYRINEATTRLLKTDKKISQIAEEVGYHDTDYFINRFIELKGCTPARYRKNRGSNSSDS